MRTPEEFLKEKNITDVYELIYDKDSHNNWFLTDLMTEYAKEAGRQMYLKGRKDVLKGKNKLCTGI